ncbi:MAG TPA: glycosyltransferase [bacterium]|nr:glycosyltransferase [bacterium]
MSAAPEVSIVIAAYNAATTLPQVLEACRRQDLDRPYEMIVVDDGSADATRAVAERGGARVLSQTNRGPAAARNYGWKSAAAHTILFTDSDCIPHSDWARLLSAGIDSTHAAACGSYGIANPGNWLAELIHAEIRWRHSRLPREVEFAGSYNFAATRGTLESIGGFDETYTAPSGEDNDLSYRLRDKGIRIRFVPNALVDHHHPTDLGRYLREQWRHGRYRVRLYATHPRRVKGDGYAGWADLVAPPLAMLSIAAFLLSTIYHPALFAAVAAYVFVATYHTVLGTRIAIHSKKLIGRRFAMIGLVRAYARGFGMIQGLGDVFLHRPR